MRTLAAVLSAILITCACATSTAPKAEKEKRSNPLYALGLMRQGSLLLQQGRYEAALDKFSEADRVSPGNATSLNMKGLCLLRLERYDEALQAFDKALELIPAFTDARNNRGATYLAMGQYRMAEVDFSAVLDDTTYPHRQEVYYNLGITYLQRNQTAAAQENFRKATKGPQPVLEAFLRLAEIDQKEGRTDEALSTLNEAVLAFPTRSEAHLQLGRLLTQLGRTDEAEDHLKAVIMNDPGSDMATEAQRLLGGE